MGIAQLFAALAYLFVIGVVGIIAWLMFLAPSRGPQHPPVASTSTPSEVSVPAELSEPAPPVHPAFTVPLRTLEGEPITLMGWRTGVLVLVVWASWCEECRGMWPMLERVAQELNVPVVAVNRGEPLSAIRSSLSATREAVDHLQDPDDILFGVLHGREMPLVVVFRDGEEKARLHPPLHEDDLVRTLSDMLQVNTSALR